MLTGYLISMAEAEKTLWKRSAGGVTRLLGNPDKGTVYLSDKCPCGGSTCWFRFQSSYLGGNQDCADPDSADCRWSDPRESLQMQCSDTNPWPSDDPNFRTGTWYAANRSDKTRVFITQGKADCARKGMDACRDFLDDHPDMVPPTPAGSPGSDEYFNNAGHLPTDESLGEDEDWSSLYDSVIVPVEYAAQAEALRRTIPSLPAVASTPSYAAYAVAFHTPYRVYKDIERTTLYTSPFTWNEWRAAVWNLTLKNAKVTMDVSANRSYIEKGTYVMVKSTDYSAGNEVVTDSGREQLCPTWEIGITYHTDIAEAESSKYTEFLHAFTETLDKNRGIGVSATRVEAPPDGSTTTVPYPWEYTYKPSGSDTEHTVPLYHVFVDAKATVDIWNNASFLWLFIFDRSAMDELRQLDFDQFNAALGAPDYWKFYGLYHTCCPKDEPPVPEYIVRGTAGYCSVAGYLVMETHCVDCKDSGDACYNQGVDPSKIITSDILPCSGTSYNCGRTYSVPKRAGAFYGPVDITKKDGTSTGIHLNTWQVWMEAPKDTERAWQWVDYGLLGSTNYGVPPGCALYTVKLDPRVNFPLWLASDSLVVNHISPADAECPDDNCSAQLEPISTATGETFYKCTLARDGVTIDCIVYRPSYNLCETLYRQLVYLVWEPRLDISDNFNVSWSNYLEPNSSHNTGGSGYLASSSGGVRTPKITVEFSDGSAVYLPTVKAYKEAGSTYSFAFEKRLIRSVFKGSVESSETVPEEPDPKDTWDVVVKIYEYAKQLYSTAAGAVCVYEPQQAGNTFSCYARASVYGQVNNVLKLVRSGTKECMAYADPSEPYMTVSCESPTWDEDSSTGHTAIRWRGSDKSSYCGSGNIKEAFQTFADNLNDIDLCSGELRPRKAAIEYSWSSAIKYTQDNPTVHVEWSDDLAEVLQPFRYALWGNDIDVDFTAPSGMDMFLKDMLKFFDFSAISGVDTSKVKAVPGRVDYGQDTPGVCTEMFQTLRKQVTGCN